MICLDTTFLVDLWREADLPDSPARRLLADHPGEDFAVAAHAAGEFLEGGAAVSPARLAESLQFLRLFRIGEIGLETALHYAGIVAHLRRNSALAGRSKPGLWIAAWAAAHASPPWRLATQSTAATSPAWNSSPTEHNKGRPPAIDPESAAPITPRLGAAYEMPP